LRLPFGDGQFDLVACQFGVMFFPDKPAAFREARRVLASGGRLLFSTWGAVGTHGFAAALAAGIERAFPGDPPAFVTAVPHGYCDLGQVTADLAAGGLECVSAELVTLDGQVGSAADVAAGFCTGTPLRMAIEHRGDLMASTALVSQEMHMQVPGRSAPAAGLQGSDLCAHPDARAHRQVRAATVMTRPSASAAAGRTVSSWAGADRDFPAVVRTRTTTGGLTW
jgi:hypothetical protein